MNMFGQLVQVPNWKYIKFLNMIFKTPICNIYTYINA